MKRWGWVGALALAGCSTSGSSAVSIDLDRVVNSEPVRQSFAQSLPRPPAPKGQRTIVTPGFGPRTLRDPADVDPARLSRLLKDEQLSARKRLEDLLQQFYKAQAKGFELDKLREHSARERELYGKASDQIRIAFDSAAVERSPKLVRLTILAGFPDDNPTSSPPVTALGSVSEARFEEAKKLRSEIGLIDATFDKTVQQILRNIEDLAAGARAKALVEIELYKADLDKKAEAEARSQVSAAAASVRLELASHTPTQLPGIPGHTLTLPAEAALHPAPEVPSKEIGQSDADRRELAQHELRIWLGLNRFVLRAGAPDRTEDFIRWRRDHRPTDTH